MFASNGDVFPGRKDIQTTSGQKSGDEINARNQNGGD